MRTRTLVGLAAIAAALVIAAFGVFAAWTYANRPLVESVSPAPGNVVDGSTPIRIVLQSPDEMTAARLLLDGRDVTASAERTGAGFVLPMPKIADGAHRMTVTVSSNGMIGSGDETYAWSFESDRTPPKLAPAIPANWTASARIAGATEPNATVTVAWDGGDVTVAADAQGRFDFAVPDVPMSITLTPGDVGDGAITHVDVETPSAVTGFALDAGTPVTGIASFTGTPVGYATLAVYDAASGLLLGQALTDEKIGRAHV